MVTKDDVAGFIERLEGGAVTSNEVEPGLWVVNTVEDAELVIHYADPVLILRLRIMTIPDEQSRQVALFRRLLELNATELVHGSYGLEGDHIVWTDTLELEHLDYGEFESSVESISLALASHVGSLAPYGEK